MGRKYLGVAVFIAAWLIVLSVPALRVMLPLPNQFDFMSDEGLAARYPDDPRVQAVILEQTHQIYNPSSFDRIQGDDLVKGYDELIRRFPQESWPIAARLKWTFLGKSAGRNVGEDTKRASPSRNALTPQQLAQAITVAEQGRRLEPDNSFYDWMLAAFLFDSDRNQEALKVLHEGAQKRSYNDHSKSQAKARIATLQLHRSLPFEAKLAAWSAIQYPHFAALRQVARTAVWEAGQMERAGDHARALQIYADVSQLGGRIIENGYTLIGSLVGQAIQRISWGGGDIRKLTMAEREAAGGGNKPKSAPIGVLPQGILTKIQSEKFARYAAAHGREDLARAARQDAQKIIAMQAADRRYLIDMGWMSSLGMDTAMMFRGAGAALLVQAAICALLWLIAAALLRRVPKNETVSDTDLASITLLIGGVVALLLIGFLRQTFLMSGDPEFRRIMFLGVLIVAVPPLLGALYCAAAIRWRHRKTFSAKPTAGSSGSGAEARPAGLSRSFIYTLAGLISWILSICAFFSWLAFVSSLNPATDSTTQITMALGFPMAALIAPLFSLAALIWWIIKWSWITPPPARSETRYAVRWYRHTLGIFTVLGSVAYLVVSLAAIPSWRAADAKVDALIKNGEVWNMLIYSQSQTASGK